jgi:hypothetical protein
MIMFCFRTALGVLCFGAVAPGLLSAQVGTVVTSRESPSVWQGVGVYYGAILPGGLSLYRQLVGGPAQGNWASLSVGASVTEELGIEFRIAERRLIPGLGFSLSARANLFDDIQFYGLGGRMGNGPIPVEQNRYSLAPTFTVSRNSNVRLDFGPVFKYSVSRFDLDDGLVPPSTASAARSDMAGSVDLAEPYGFGGFGQLGAQANLTLGGTMPGSTLRNVSITVGGSAFPATLDVAKPFTEVHGEARRAFSFNAPGSPVLALRAGGKKVWGSVPVHEAAFLGGNASLRALSSRSLVGDAAVHVGAELRLTAGEVTVMKRRVQYGFLGLADLGRVFYDGASPHGWLADVGAGLWLEPMGLGRVLTFGAARGPLGARFFLGAGM